MKFNMFLTIITLVLILSLFGCTSQAPICGDNVCSELETNPSSSYFCTNDCGSEINQISKTSNWGNQIYCPDCQNTSCSSSSSKSNQSNSSIYDDSKCADTHSCASLKVSCLNDKLWNCSILKGGSAGCVGDCEIIMNSTDCTNMFGVTPNPNYARFLSSSFLNAPVDTTNIQKAFSQCIMKHEMQHAIENCQCHNCKKEIKARNVQSDCYREIYSNANNGNYNLPPTQKIYVLDLIERELKRMSAEQNYHNCLCNNRTNNSNDESNGILYKEGTCAKCIKQLEDAFKKINSETTNPNITPLPTNLTNTNKLYCKKYEKKGNYIY